MKFKMADGHEELLDQARKTSAYFSSLIELIPLKHYLPDDENIDGSVKTNLDVSGKAAREAKKALAKKAKMLKLDPGKQKSIADLQKEIEEKEKEMHSSHGNDAKLVTSGIKPIKVSEIQSVPLEDLRKKLEDKIQELRGKRKIKESGNADKVKKRKVEKLARKEKLKQEATSSNVLKSNVESERKVTQILNDKKEVVFSKFDFAETSAKKKNSKNKDIKTLLKKAEKRKANLESIETEDKEKASELKSKIKWDKALKQAEGIKVKDDPKLLSKTLKKKQKSKEASKRKWDERIKTQKKVKEDKQKLRKQHLVERKESKGTKGGKNKKMNKNVKKHKPGF